MLGNEDHGAGASRQTPGTPGAVARSNALITGIFAEGSGDEGQGRGSDTASAAIAAAAGGTPQVGDVHNQEAEQFEDEAVSDPLNNSNTFPPGWSGGEGQLVELPSAAMVLKMACESTLTMEESLDLSSGLAGSMREEDGETVYALMGSAMFRHQPEVIRERARAILISSYAQQVSKSPLNEHLLPQTKEAATKWLKDTSLVGLPTYDGPANFFHCANALKAKAGELGLAYIFGYAFKLLLDKGEITASSDLFE